MAWRWFLAAGVAATVAFLLAPAGGLLQAQIFIAFNGAAVVAVAAGVRRHRPEPAGAWRLLVAAGFIYWVATVVWQLYPLLSGRALPFPSVVDALYWMSYVGWFLFLTAVIRRHAAGESGQVLDAVILAAGVSTLGYELLLAPLLGTDLPPAVMVSSVAYPVLLTALTAAALRAAVAPARACTVHVLMAGWIALELTADVWYSITAVQGVVHGDPWCAVWLLSYTLLGALGLHPDLASLTDPTGPTRAMTRRSRAVLLAVALLSPVAAIVIADDVLGYEHQPLVVRSIFVVIVIAVVVRLFQTLGDLAEEKRLRGELEYATLHDRLTGLANRVGFEQALRRALATRHDDDRAAMVLMLDLDGFKAVNDTYGHEAGDRILVEIATRLTAGVRDADTVARLGGDEFPVVIDDIDLTEGLALADRLAAAVTEPIDIGPATPRIGVSIGVYPTEPGDDPDAVMRRADTAMYAAKTAGGGVQLFHADRHRRFLDRYQLEVELRAAPTAGELVLHYQPIVGLDGRAIVAAEALVRWQHPQRGLLMPDEFIELAETSGAIIDIGRWVLHQACRDAVSWQDRVGTPDDWRGVAVNVSRRQLTSPTIVTDIAQALSGSGLPAHLLTVEVTETALVDDVDDMIAVMHELKMLGVDLAMDDFGTGYSSLTDLQRMPIDVIKIAQAFVAGIARTYEEWTLASAIVGLATGLDKRTLAEGIEEPSQLAHLRSLGCELGQGYLFARPMPAHELARELLNELADFTPRG